MSFSFAVLKDAVRTSVASYVPGSGSLTVATGSGILFPAPTPAAPVLLTVVTTATYATYPETYGTYQATGITGDTLTGLTLVSGNDMAWGIGAIVEMRTCAKHLNDLAAQSGSGGGGGGSGTVGSGTAGQPAVYSAAGTAVAGSSKGLIINQHLTATVVPSGTSGTVTLDLSAGDLFAPGTMTGNVTLALSNPPAGGLTQTFRILVKQAASGGPFSLTYPSGVVWVGSSTAPDMTAVPAGQTLELVFTYFSSGLILGHFPGTTNTDPAGGGGSGTITETSETASFTAAAGGYYVVSGSAAVTATLPTAVGIAGQTVRVRCAAGYTGLCTITGTSGQTINGAATRIIYAGESPLLQSDGTNWIRTGGAVIPAHAQLTLGSDQSPPVPGGGVAATVQCNTVAFDNTGLMTVSASYQIKIPRPGQYRLSAAVYYGTITTAVSDIYTYSVTFGKNAGNTNPTATGTVQGGGIAFTFVVMSSGGVTLAAGDLITVIAAVTHVGGQAVPLVAGTQTFFEAVEIPSW